MKKVFLILASVSIITLIGYQNKEALSQKADTLFQSSKCDTPIPYVIGTIDPRFNITQNELATYTQEASNIWGSAFGKKLFASDPKAALTINLVYDERQRLNTQINQLDETLKQKSEGLKPGISDYHRRAAEYKKKVAQLNEEINKWNNQGGAPEDVYNKLIAEQAALKKEADALNAEANSLNQSTESYNTQVEELQQQVGAYNQTLTYKPEEGVYISDETGQRIVIYFYTNKQELVHTLAHEMGHALGLDHSNNTQAIMFSRTNNIIIPSADDITALKYVCRKRNFLEITEEKLTLLRIQLQMIINNVAKNTKSSTNPN